MKIYRFNIILFFIITKINNVLNDIASQNYCYTNLECLETGCCNNNKCSSASKCKKVNKICYTLVGCAGLIFIGIAFLAFFFKIKKIRKSVLAVKKIDDKFYSKRRNSNADMFRRLRSKQGALPND